MQRPTSEPSTDPVGEFRGREESRLNRNEGRRQGRRQRGEETRAGHQSGGVGLHQKSCRTAPKGRRKGAQSRCSTRPFYETGRGVPVELCRVAAVDDKAAALGDDRAQEEARGTQGVNEAGLEHQRRHWWPLRCQSRFSVSSRSPTTPGSSWTPACRSGRAGPPARRRPRRSPRAAPRGRAGTWCRRRAGDPWRPAASSARTAPSGPTRTGGS